MVLEIVTPEAVLYKGKVSVVTLPGAKGSFQILENHAPIVSLLEKGTLSFRESEVPTICVQERFAQEKGFLLEKLPSPYGMHQHLLKPYLD